MDIEFPCGFNGARDIDFRALISLLNALDSGNSFFLAVSRFFEGVVYAAAFVVACFGEKWCFHSYRVAGGDFCDRSADGLALSGR